MLPRLLLIDQITATTLCFSSHCRVYEFLPFCSGILRSVYLSLYFIIVKITHAFVTLKALEEANFVHILKFTHESFKKHSSFTHETSGQGFWNPNTEFSFINEKPFKFLIKLTDKFVLLLKTFRQIFWNRDLTSFSLAWRQKSVVCVLVVEVKT